MGMSTCVYYAAAIFVIQEEHFLGVADSLDLYIGGQPLRLHGCHPIIFPSIDGRFAELVQATRV
jgi:hypothetical protein